MSIKLFSAGDYMTGENVHHYHRGIPRRYKDNYYSLIDQQVKEILSEGDLLILNLEAALSSYERLSDFSIDDSVFIAPDETLDLLTSINIQIIANIANNHFSQHGIEIVEYTLEKLRSRNILVIGLKNEPLTIQLNGLNIKLWGVSLIKDKNFNGSYFHSSYNDLIEDLNLELKESDEFRIISIHWGNEYLTMPSKEQKDLAVKLVDNGFDLILGHHPHVVQPAEKIKDSWVVYSHGNFIFDQNFSALTQKGLISNFSLPDNKGSFYFSQQKDYKVVEVKEATIEELHNFCLHNYSLKMPFKMRIKMKTELITHLDEINFPIIKTFGKRLFGIH